MVVFEKIKQQFPRLSTTILFCLLFFVLSNHSGIYGGVCSSSPCSSLNHTFWDTNTIDHFISSETIAVLAPTVLILPSVFQLQGFEVLDNSPYWYIETGFDADLRNDDQKNNQQILQDDVSSLSKNYFLIKFVVLLSLPYWLLLIWLGKRFLVAKVIISGVLLLSLLVWLSGLYWSSIVGVGDSNVTWNILLGYIKSYVR